MFYHTVSKIDIKNLLITHSVLVEISSGVYPKQEAQLSQRDCATTVWVSFGQNISRRGYSAPALISLSTTIVM